MLGRAPAVPVAIRGPARLAAVLGSYALRPPGRGRALAAIPGRDELLVAGDGPPTLWSVADGAELGRLRGRLRGHARAATFAAAVSPDGRLAATGGADPEVIVWDLRRRRPRARVPARRPVLALAWSADSTRLLVSDGRSARLLDARGGAELARLAGHASFVTAVALSPDGRLAATGAGDRKIRLHALDDVRALDVGRAPGGQRATGVGRAARRSGRVVLVLRAASRALGFSPAGDVLYSSGWDHLAAWDASTGRERWRVDLRFPGPHALSPDGSHLAVAGDDELLLVRAHDGRIARRARLGGAPVVAFTADGAHVLVAAEGPGPGLASAVRRFEAATGREAPWGEGHLGPVTAIATVGAGARARIVSGSADGTIGLWDAARPGLERALALPGAVEDLALTPDGALLVAAVHAGASGRSATVWDLRAGRPRRALPGPVAVVAVSPDGSLAASAGTGDGRIRLWRLPSGSPLRALERHRARVCDLAFHAASRLLLSGGADGLVQVWDLISGEARDLGPHGGAVRAVTFAGPDRVLSGSTGELFLWELASGRRRTLRCGADREVTGLAATLDGRRAAAACTVGDVGAVTVWDLERRRAITTIDLRPGVDRAGAVAFDAAGRLLVGTNRGPLLVFDL